jgi:hypothetical protein
VLASEFKLQYYRKKKERKIKRTHTSLASSVRLRYKFQLGIYLTLLEGPSQAHQFCSEADILPAQAALLTPPGCFGTCLVESWVSLSSGATREVKPFGVKCCCPLAFAWFPVPCRVKVRG